MWKEPRPLSREPPMPPKALTKLKKSNPPKRALKNPKTPPTSITSNLSSNKNKTPSLMKKRLSKKPRNN
jgi:hypothetical protein